jgi:tripeptidyl-peptidase-1
LATFQNHFNLTARPIDKVVGPNVESDPGLEANLDVQYIGAMGRNISTWFISTNRTANVGQEDFLYWATDLVDSPGTPWVHSVSYGDQESSTDFDYRIRLDAEFQKLGTLGRTILFASGDSGVSCTRDNKFDPDWPTSSPYVTAVGGTQSNPEVTCSFGGSGFSNTYGMPDYQKAAVQAYLNSGVAPAASYYNGSGRAYPDVSALAVGFEIVVNGFLTGVSGTSCSAPTWAGVVAALNDVRLTAGKNSLGFLNPLLYQLGVSHPEGFHDITSGSNPFGACPGFKATKSWDAATGWGSPIFSVLKTLV